MFVGPNAPGALAPRLPALNDSGDRYAVTARTTGPWSFVTSNFVCAPVSASVSAAGNQGFVELMAEATPTGFDQLCIQQVVGHDFSAEVAADVFDGFTLDLRPLSGAHPASLFVFGNISTETTVPDGNTTFDTWYQLDEFGDATVTLTGR